MKRIVSMVVLGIAGLVVALALTVGALALAGSDVGEVVQPQVSTQDRSPDSPSASADDDASNSPSTSASSTPDDDSSGPGSDDDSSGPGSDDDSSGPGSGDDGHSDDDD